METTLDQNVRGELNALEIGATARFPIERYEYVLACRTKLSKTTGKKFSSTTNATHVIITRDE